MIYVLRGCSDVCLVGVKPVESRKTPLTLYYYYTASMHPLLLLFVLLFITISWVSINPCCWMYLYWFLVGQREGAEDVEGSPKKLKTPSSRQVYSTAWYNLEQDFMMYYCHKVIFFVAQDVGVVYEFRIRKIVCFGKTILWVPRLTLSCCPSSQWGMTLILL